MVLPTPPVALKDHCSVIHNGVLYTYQVDAFQTLDLKSGAQWSKMPLGVPTDGSVCVLGSGNEQDSLFIVGGSTNGSAQYPGLQRYSFADNKWETCSPAVNVASGRKHHGAAFLQDSSSILIYGGSQDGTATLSSQTFTVSTVPPFNVQAFNSDAPPVTDPEMMPFNTSHGLMLGGEQYNKKLFTFSPADGWRQLNVDLKNALKDASLMQTTLLTGTDGSKLLEIFDLSVSPNQIWNLLLQNATQSPKSPSKHTRSLHTLSERKSKKRKRETVLADRPAYNSTLAPQGTRNGYSLARDPTTGLVVASGGNSGDDQNLLAMFNETGNQWIDPNSFFGNEAAKTPTPSPSSTSSSLASLSGKPTATGASHSAATKNRSLTILGATLGAVFGLAALLVLILVLLRYFRRRKEKIHKRRVSDFPMDDKDGMDFTDRGAEFMKEAGGSFSHTPKHSGHSAASMGVSMGAPRADSKQSQRKILHRQGDSGGSAKSFWSKAKSPQTSPPQISHPFPVTEPTPALSPEPRAESRADTGWSKYFINNSATNFQNQPNNATTRPTTYNSASGSQSDYTSSRVTSSHPHESAEVQPLNLRTSNLGPPYPPNARVVSPTRSHNYETGLAVSSEHELQSPETLVSDIDEEDEYQHSSSAQESWTPVETSQRGSTWSDQRPVSSVYDPAFNHHPGDRVPIPNFPRVPSSRGQSTRNSQVGTTGTATPISAAPAPNISRNDSRGLRNMAANDFGAVHPQQALPETTQRIPAGYQVQDARMFPRREGAPGPTGWGRRQRGPETEDMSWLNLGNGR